MKSKENSGKMSAGVGSGLSVKEAIPKGYTPSSLGQGNRPTSKGTVI